VDGGSPQCRIGGMDGQRGQNTRRDLDLNG
jgi:hypothetical protein